MDELGFALAQADRIFLSLRSGRICEISAEEREGYVPKQTKNAAGEIFHFFAKEYEYLTGYITEVKWHKHEFGDGQSMQGWNLTIDTGGTTKFILGVMSKDRPYHRLMSCLANVDFNNPVRLVAFLGRNQNSGRGQKVLLLYQDGEINPETGKETPVQPKYPERWLSQLLIQKLKDGTELTDSEKRSVAYITKDGKEVPDNSYPYIRQKKDETWSFDSWTDFLLDKMQDEVLPAVQEATSKRAPLQRPITQSEEFDSVSSFDDDGGDDPIPF